MDNNYGFRSPTQNDLKQSNNSGFRKATFRDLKQHESQTIQRALAEKYVDSNKNKYAIIEYEEDAFKRYDQNSKTWHPIHVEDIQNGMSINFGNCMVKNLETDETRAMNVFVRDVMDCVCKYGVVCVESQTAVFASVDFSKELADIAKERVQEQGIDIER